MKLFEIRTKAWKNEDFMLVTDLEYVDIIQVIMPIVNAERAGGEAYTSLTLMEALRNEYPSATIQLYFELIIIKI